MEVIWSNMATKHLESILEYVEQEFGDKTAVKTLSKISDKVERIAKFPTSGIKNDNYSTDLYMVRHITITPNIIYYLCYPDAIVIAAIVHTKQSPRTINAILRRFLDSYDRTGGMK